VFDHLQVYDPRERAVVGTADALLGLATRLERFVGLDALAPRRRPVQVPATRILLLRLERIGDLLMSLDAMAEVRRIAPEAEIDLVVGSWNEGLARLIPGIDRVHTLDAPWLARRDGGPSFVQLLRRAAREWAPRHYDVAINFEGDIR
jgi:hypothetical protein